MQLEVAMRSVSRIGGEGHVNGNGHAHANGNGRHAVVNGDGANGAGGGGTKQKPAMPPFPTQLFKHMLARYVRENFSKKERDEHDHYIGVIIGNAEGSGSNTQIMSPLENEDFSNAVGGVGAACLRAAMLVNQAAAELEAAGADESRLFPADNGDKIVENLHSMVTDLTAAVGHAMICRG